MPWPKEIVFVRHAESEGNVRSVDERAAYDVATQEYPLTERGRRQAELTGERLREAYGPFDVHYVSYYERSRETMRIMCPDAEAIEDERLAEADRGIYHTLTHAQIAARYPDELSRKDRLGLYHYRAPGGENWPDVELRIRSFRDTLKDEHGGQKVLIVGHGFWLMLFEKIIQRFSIKEALRRYAGDTSPNAAITTYAPSLEDPSTLILGRRHEAPWEGKI